ncbi:MAG: GNAT family N-acetyltransferase [Hyphomicrobium sp.]
MLNTMMATTDVNERDLASIELPGVVRRLWPAESAMFRDHLLRLDAVSRRMRFAHGVSDSFICGYADHMSETGALTYAYVEDGEVRAAAELKQVGGHWGQDAEAAFSVEGPHQDRGLGTELLGRVIRAARNRGIHHVILNCLAENERMQAVAKKHDAGLRIEQGEVTGEIIPEASGYFSFLEEAYEVRAALVFGFLDMQTRLQRSSRSSNQSNSGIANPSKTRISTIQHAPRAGFFPPV